MAVVDFCHLNCIGVLKFFLSFLFFLCQILFSWYVAYIFTSNQVSELETVSDIGDAAQTKAAYNGRSLGKKMRAISLTMKKKMGKKYIKALSEEMVITA